MLARSVPTTGDLTSTTSPGLRKGSGAGVPSSSSGAESAAVPAAWYGSLMDAFQMTNEWPDRGEGVPAVSWAW